MKKIFYTFKPISTEIEWKSYSELSGILGISGLISRAGYTSRWYEHKVFIDNKPFLRYKSTSLKKITIKRFLFVCLLEIK